VTKQAVSDGIIAARFKKEADVQPTEEEVLEEEDHLMLGRCIKTIDEAMSGYEGEIEALRRHRATAAIKPRSVSVVGAPFTAFATKRDRTDSSSTNNTDSCPPITVATTFDSSDTDRSDSLDTLSSKAPSPLSLPSPAAHPQEEVSSTQLRLSITPKSYLEYSQRYQQKNKLIKPPRVKKDRRPQERKLLIQIATSAFYLLQTEQQEEEYECLKLQYYPGMQDLIAVLLLHLESPSLTSLVLKQIINSHLWMYCSATPSDDDEDEGSFASCIEDGDDCCDEDADSSQDLDVLSLAFFPLLQIIDEELHSSLLQKNDQHVFIKSQALEDFIIGSQALVIGNVLRKWMSSWFCCHDTLPLEVVSRVIDFFLASHPSMPL
jgi:hypothetical protein